MWINKKYLKYRAVGFIQIVSLGHLKQYFNSMVHNGLYVTITEECIEVNTLNYVDYTSIR